MVNCQLAMFNSNVHPWISILTTEPKMRSRKPVTNINFIHKTLYIIRFTYGISRLLCVKVLLTSLIFIKAIAFVVCDITRTIILRACFAVAFASVSIASCCSKVIRSKDKHRSYPITIRTTLFNGYKSSFVCLRIAAFLLLRNQ